MSTLIDRVKCLTGVALASGLVLLSALTPETARAQAAAASNVIQVSGQVGVVNRANRTLTLIDGTGKAVTIAVPEAARNFDQIKRGDTLNLGYIETVELFLSEPGTAPGVQAGEASERAEEGELPAGMMAQAMQINAKVTAIDAERRILTLLLDDEGSEVQKELPEGVDAGSLKVGDTVSVRLSRVLAAEITRPEQ